jgi:transposase-like protein
MHEMRTKGEAVVEKTTVVAEPDGNVLRGRPGRRTVEERQQAVLDVLVGKASVDQGARRLGVLPATVEGWRQEALAGVAEAMRRGTAKSVRELALEREVTQLRRVVTDTAIEKELRKQALAKEREGRPPGLGRSSP